MKLKAIVLIFLVSLIIYSNSLAGQFVWDDEYFIVKNRFIRSVSNFPLFFTYSPTIALGGLSKDIYRPLVTLSYAVDYSLWGLNSFGYHLTNVIIHSLNGMLLFLLLYLIFDKISLAFFTSLLFISHPIETETVSWISGRSNLLFLLFYLLSLFFYIKFSKRHKKNFYIISLISFALSLFSKEMAISLPLILVTYDIHFSKSENFKKRVLKYIPYFLLMLFYLIIRTSLLKRISQMGWWGDSPYYTILTMSKVTIDYIKILFWPKQLCANYFVPISVSPVETKVFLSLVFLIFLFICLPFIFKRSKKTSFGIWWFFTTMLPVSNIIPLKALMAERFLYLPSIGLCMILAFFIDWLNKEIGFLNRKGIFIAVPLTVIIILGYSVRTFIRNEDWKDTLTISKRTIEANPLNAWALTSFGGYLLEEEKYTEAIKNLKKAILISKDYARAHESLGGCYLKLGRYEDAIQEFKETLRLSPDEIDARNSMGVSYAQLKKYDEAEDAFRTVLRIEPTYFDSYLNLAKLYEMKGDYANALALYEKLISNTKVKLHIAIAYMRIGDSYVNMGLKDKARIYYQKVIDMRRREVAILKNLAVERISKL